jgi:hypothetical protein
LTLTNKKSKLIETDLQRKIGLRDFSAQQCTIGGHEKLGQDDNCIKSKIIKFGFLPKGYKNYAGLNDIYLSKPLS